MSDLHEATAPPGGEPPAPRSRRVLLIVLACVVIAALVSVLVVALGGSNSGSRSTGSGSAQPTSRPDTTGGRIDPSQRLDTEAAVRYGWTLSANDEFDGDELDRDLWSPYRGRTTDDVGQHVPANITVSDGTMKITSRGDTSGGMSWKEGQKYGRWEVRARAQKGNGYGPVLLLWPDAEDWPEGGEIDFMEIPKGERTRAYFNLHWGEDDTTDGKGIDGDFTQWHTFATEWTEDGVVGYLDGVEYYRNEDSDANPPRSMHLAIQQDIGPYGTDWIPAPDSSTPDEVVFEVDWVRIYAP